MIEIVAQLYCDAYCDRVGAYEGLPEWAKENHRKLARAAIAAMREPTAAMVAAPVIKNWAWLTGETVQSEEIADTWRSMIDAALI